MFAWFERLKSRVAAVPEVDPQDRPLHHVHVRYERTPGARDFASAGYVSGATREEIDAAAVDLLKRIGAEGAHFTLRTARHAEVVEASR